MLGSCLVLGLHLLRNSTHPLRPIARGHPVARGPTAVDKRTSAAPSRARSPHTAYKFGHIQIQHSHRAVKQLVVLFNL
eukprot:scaffold86255_cov31-Tisochrysis_lutea.AAC.5